MLLFHFFYFHLLFLGSLDQEWINFVQERHDPRAEEWYYSVLKNRLKETKPDRVTEELSNKSKNIIKKQCRLSESLSFEDYDTPLLVAMTFDLPDSLWQELSEDIQAVGGAFIIRGVPNDSFSELSRRLKVLADKGVNARILIDPKSFKEYQVESAPTFIALDGNRFDKLTGNVTLCYALQKMVEEGETLSSKNCLTRLKELK